MVSENSKQTVWVVLAEWLDTPDATPHKVGTEHFSRESAQRSLEVYQRLGEVLAEKVAQLAPPRFWIEERKRSE